MRGDRLRFEGSTRRPSFRRPGFMIVLLSTKELVRKGASRVPHWRPIDVNKSFIYIVLKQSSNMQFLAGPFLCSGSPKGFLKCANGTHLPLTVPKSSASMRIKLGKIFSYSSGEQKSADAWNDSHSLCERSSKSLI